MIKPMKMFYIKPEMDIELVEVESFLAESQETPFIDEPVTQEAPEFTWD